jgi:putative DNA primase/helicase
MANLILASDDDRERKAEVAERVQARLDGADVPDEPVTGNYLTELWTAERLVARYGADLRYSVSHGWFVYDGRRWKRDDALAVEDFAVRTVRSLYGDAEHIDDYQDRKRLVDHAKKCETSSKINAIINLARCLTGVPIRAENLDADPWSLNCQNGTIDLRTGNLRPHDRADLITKIAPVVYDRGAECPQWIKFLNDIFADDASMIAFSQRGLGSALSAYIREHTMHVWYGVGANGKSTLINCTIGLLGDYAKTAPPKLLIRRDRDAHPTELADLHGVRFLATVETAEGGRLDEERVKQLTGGDRIKARYMCRDFFEFAGTHHLFVATNHRPDVRGQDHAIWRRIFLWPFTVVIPDDQQDHDLPTKLQAEWPGILRWLVDGVIAWQRSGLDAPASVKAATQKYRDDSDLIGQFLDESCKLGRDCKVGGGAFYWAYRTWTLDNGGQPCGNPTFSRRILERPGITRPDNTAYREYCGVGLQADWQTRYENRKTANTRDGSLPF